MKLIIIFLSLTLIFTNLKGQNISLTNYKDVFEEEIKDWASTFENFNIEEFKEYKSNPFDNNYKQDFKRLDSFYALYKPILSFSPDSLSFIDIYSYQLNLKKQGNKYFATVDVDQAILLCNKKAKYWDRIFFGTPSSWVEKAIWLSNSKFLLLVSELDENDLRKPYILFGDFDKQTLTAFKSSNNSCFQKTSYIDPKLKRLNIIDL